jgi:hypothetical protein
MKPIAEKGKQSVNDTYNDELTVPIKNMDLMQNTELIKKQEESVDRT